MRLREVPPTFGLAPRLTDMLAAPWGGDDLAGLIARFLGAEEVELECSGTACLVIAFEYRARPRALRRNLRAPRFRLGAARRPRAFARHLSERRLRLRD